MQLLLEQLVVAPLHQRNLLLQGAMVKRVGGLVKIPLTQGKWATVDKGDYELVKGYKWYAQRPTGSIYYAVTKIFKNGKPSTELMHRMLLNPAKGMVVDHQDHNGLNNSRSNIRTCTASENMYNTRRRKSRSGIRGVTWREERKKFIVRIRVNNKEIPLGAYADCREASKVYDDAAKKYHGKFAAPNQI